ncbi:MAG TPA: hypothetical protein DEA08_05615 [Planctomycetes bacterium]|nr:hypothetical protein [Planctomycetota bacterium]
MGEGSRERDLVLAPNEYAYISDQTKGNINAYVGPYKTSLANTDQPVFFDERSKRFERCSLEQATKIFATAPEGWYITLKNPPSDDKPPQRGTVNSLPELKIGHKVNLPGPASFALWPGQMARVVKGHALRSNHYLLARVYEEESAKQSWGEAVIRPAGEGEALPADELTPSLTLGQFIVIKGTDVSFYIPPTGIEVVRDRAGNYVRQAVTLERLEYCILLDEDGNKRFIQGPAVVFPEPTEQFVTRGGRRKFKAIELNEISGLYVKVIAPYSDDQREYQVGDELFITGQEQMIYFPRPEHAVIKYGEQEIHYAVAIPAGEGRYCLDRRTGQVRLVRGPKMFLPDPRREVIVRRVLDPHHVELWFPGNREALQVNQQLKEELRGSGGEMLVQAAEPLSEAVAFAEDEVLDELVGDDFRRRPTYTPPRTLTLDTKYEGAVGVSVWTGYAMLVVSRSGERQVLVGPHARLLEYDETLEPMELSTGTPKSDERLLKTAYLRVLHNKVSDVVEAETQDLVPVSIRLSYRVNFEGEPERWFNVENYVKFLTEHMRSLLRNAVKRRGIEEFYAQSIDVVRDTVLGLPGEEGKRPGRPFSENGMRIYDVEVLDVKIENDAIEELLVEAQQSVFAQTLQLQAERRRLNAVQETEVVKREVATAQTATELRQLELRAESIKRKHEVELTEVEAQSNVEQKRLSARLSDEQAISQIEEVSRVRKQATAELRLEIAEREQAQRLAELQAEAAAVVTKAGAVSPDLIAALQAFGDKALVERVSESMAPLAILGGESVTEVLAKLLHGTALEKVLPAAPQRSGKKGKS